MEPPTAGVKFYRDKDNDRFEQRMTKYYTSNSEQRSYKYHNFHAIEAKFLETWANRAKP